MRVTAEQVSLSFDTSIVLRDVTAAVHPGELLGLIGPNGAGKSSLLRVLAGLVTPDGGRVRYDDVSGAEVGRRELARKIAFLPQVSPVYWPVSVERLVMLGRTPHRRPLRGPRSADGAAVQRAMARTGTVGLRGRSVSSLSGGERMRVMVARMLAVEAPVLLADEPVSALDPYYQLQFMDLFAAEAARGCAVMVVLHDLALAARYCHRLLLMDAGRIVAAGMPGDVLSPDTVERVYRVQALTGRHDNRLFVLPWRHSPGRTDSEDRDER